MSTRRRLERPVDLGGELKQEWCPNGDATGPLLVVMQGDLTACSADGIVNPANSRLSHGGGLAKAIVRKGGFIIQKKSDEWIRRHRALAVGCAMSTTAGELPCYRVIHTVGPEIIGHGRTPTDDEAVQLRSAVWSVLEEADRLGLMSLAMPGISTGSFGYPVDLGAAEIVRECIRFCRERAATTATTTTLRTIVLMNKDDRTVASFVEALQNEVHRDVTALGTVASPAGHYHLFSESREYATTGVLLVRTASTGYEVLLSVKNRSDGDSSGEYLSFLGGKQVPDEQPSDTAARTFSAEVGEIVPRNQVCELLANHDKTRQMRLPFATTSVVLFIAHSEATNVASLPEEYEKHRRRSTGLRVEHLEWVSWKAIVTAARDDQQSASLETQQGRVALSSVLCHFVRQWRTQAKQIFQQIVLTERENAKNATNTTNITTKTTLTNNTNNTTKTTKTTKTTLTNNTKNTKNAKNTNNTNNTNNTAARKL